MCFHTKNTKTITQLENRFNVSRTDRFDFEETDFYFYHANGYTHREHLIIPQEKPTIFSPSLWGIMPSNIKGYEQDDYYKKSVRFGGGLNAQSEKLFDHFIYKNSAFTRRCIVPLDGFYEPHTASNNLKIPFHFKRKDNEAFGVAGIYNLSPDMYVSMTILTKEASPLFAKIHNKKFRQPVLLNKDLEKEWLRNDLSKENIVELINQEYPEDELEAYPISRDLFMPNIDSDREDIIEKVNYEELNTLF